MATEERLGEYSQSKSKIRTYLLQNNKATEETVDGLIEHWEDSGFSMKEIESKATLLKPIGQDADEIAGQLAAQAQSQPPALNTAEPDVRRDDYKSPPIEDNIESHLFGTGRDTPTNNAFRENVQLRGLGLGRRLNEQQVSQIDIPADVQRAERWSNKRRVHHNEMRMNQGQTPIAINDDMAWSVIESPGNFQFESPAFKNNKAFRPKDAAVTAGLTFVDAATAGVGNYVDALMMSTGAYDDPHYANFMAEHTQGDFRGAGFIRGASNVAGFLAPTKWAGIGVKAGGKLVKVAGGKKLAQVITSKAAGSGASAALKGAAHGPVNKGVGLKVTEKVLGGIEKGFNATAKYAGKATAIPTKVLYELPLKAAGAGVGKVLGKKVTDEFVKASTAALANSSVGIVNKLLAKSALKKIGGKAALISKGTLGKAVSETITAAWKESRGTTIRRLLEAGEKDGIANTMEIFKAKISKAISKELGEDISSDVVQRATRELSEAFEKELTAGPATKGIDRFRRMLTAPLGLKGPKAALAGEAALDVVEGSVAMGVHSQVVTFNALLGQSLMSLQQSGIDTDNLNPFEKGNLYLGTAKSFYDEHREYEPAWVSYAIGGIFHTGAGFKYMPSNFPLVGSLMNRAGHMSITDRVARIVGGPKISEDVAFKIFAKELTPAHDQIMTRAREILGLKPGQPLNKFYHNLSIRAAQSTLAGNLKKKAAPISKRIFDKLRGIGKKPESMNNDELAATGAMMRALREKFVGPEAALRKGQQRPAGSYRDYLGFENADLEILASKGAHTAKEIAKAREKVIGALEGTHKQLWSRYRHAQSEELLKDLGVVGLRALPVFAATGGLGMIDQLRRNGGNEEVASNLLLHSMMSLWATQSPRFRDGVHLAPSGWHRGRKLRSAQELPGWSDARVEIAGLEREMFYMGGGSTDFQSGQGARASGVSIEGIMPIKTQKGLINKLNAAITKNSREQAVLRGVKGLGNEPADQKYPAIIPTHPGAKTGALQQEATAQGRELKLVDISARQNAIDTVAALSANDVELGDEMNINGLNPTRDGTEWIKAMNEDESGISDDIAAVVQVSLHEALSDMGVNQSIDPNNFTFLPMASALNAGVRKILVDTRGAALETLHAIRSEQLQGAVDLKSGQMVDRFQFEGKENEGLNRRIENFLNVATAFELAVGHSYLEEGADIGAGKVTDNKSMFDVADIMDKDTVINLLDRFDEFLAKYGFHESLNVANPELRNSMYNATERSGRSLAAELMGAIDQPLPVLNSIEGVATKKGVMEAIRASGFMLKENGTYIAKTVAQDVLDGMSYNKRMATLSLMYIARNQPGVFVPSDKLMLSDEARARYVVTRESQLTHTSPYVFEASTHPMTGPLPRFKMQGGIVELFQEIGLPLNNYEWIKEAFGEIHQHQNALITDTEVAALNAADDAGMISRSEKGMRIKPPVQLINRGSEEVPTHAGMDHDLSSIFDAIRGMHKDARATGDLNFVALTTDLLIAQAESMYSNIYKRDMPSSVMQELMATPEYIALDSFISIFDSIIAKGFKVTGWATTTNKVDGDVEEFVSQVPKNETAFQQLQSLLNPLEQAWNAREKREQMKSLREFVIKSKGKNPTQTKALDWMQRRIQTIISFDNPKAMRDLQFLLGNTGALRLTQKGGRPTATLNLEYLDKGNNLENTIKKLELMEYADIGTANVRERMLEKQITIVDELSERNPVNPEHKYGHKVADLFIDIGLGNSNDNSIEAMRNLFVASDQMIESGTATMDELRKQYTSILSTAVRNITSEGIPADNIYIAGPTDRRSMLEALSNINDNQLLAILHNTSNMATYREITPGAVAVGSSSSVKSTNKAGDITIEARSVKVSNGTAQAEIKTRSHGPIDRLSDAYGMDVHNVKQVNSETGKNTLTDEGARSEQQKLYWEQGVIGLSQGENPDHLVNSAGGPIRMAIVEVTEGTDRGFETPVTRDQLIKYGEWLRDLSTIRTAGEDEMSSFIQNTGRMADFLLGRPESPGQPKVVGYITRIDKLGEDAVKSYDLYDVTLSEGSFDFRDITNAFRLGVRRELFGDNGMDASVRDAGVKNTKRMTQFYSDSAQRISGQSVDLAIEKVIGDIMAREGEAVGTSARELIDSMSTGGTGSNRRWRIMPVKEAKELERNGVTGLDGNFAMHPLLGRIHAELLGFDSSQDIYAAIKGFHAGDVVIDGQSQGLNQLGKPLMSVPSPRAVDMMERMGIAGWAPPSVVKIGANAIDFRDVNVGGNQTDVNIAAFQVGRGATVGRLEENVLELGVEDFNFQQMPHPIMNEASISGQAMENWHPNVVKSFTGDQALFPVDLFVGFARAVLGDGTVNGMALSRALMTNRDMNAPLAYGDLQARRASLLDTIMAQSPFVSPSVFFRKAIEAKVLKAMRSALFMGKQRTGGKSYLNPNEGYNQDTGEFYNSGAAKNTPVSLDQGKFSAKLTKRLVRDAKGKILVDEETGRPVTEDYTPEMAADDQSRRHKFQEGAGNYYNRAAEGVKMIEDGATTWNDYNILGEGKDNVLAGIIEEWYAGGHTGVRMTNFTPLQQMFTGDVVKPENFDKAVGIVAEVANLALSNPNVDDLVGVGGLIDIKARELDAVTGDPDITDAFSREVSSYLINVLHHGGDFGGLTQPHVGDGHITEGNLKAFYDTVFGNRQGEEANHETDGFQKDLRQRGVDSKTELANHDGKTPVTYGQAHMLFRSPMIQPNDRVVARNLAFLSDNQGPVAEINRGDATEKMQADNDGDKINTANSLPHDVFAEALRLNNIMGSFGDQKPRQDNSGFTWVVRKGVSENLATASGNQGLRLLKDKQTAAIMKGQLIGARSTMTQFIADNFTMIYPDKLGAEITVGPENRYNEFMEKNMNSLITVMKKVQQVLDVEGAFMPDELKGMNMDHEVFGPIMGKSTKRSDRPAVKATRDLSAQGSRGVLSAAEYTVLGSARRFYTELAAITGDDFSGGEATAKTYSIMMDKSIEMLKTIEQGGPGMVKYIQQDLKDLGYYNEDVEFILKGMRIETENNELYAGSVAKWIVRVGRAMEGDYARTAAQNQGKAALSLATGETAVQAKMRRIQMLPDMQAYMKHLETQKAKEQAANGPNTEKYKLTKAQAQRIKLEEDAMRGEIYEPTGRELLTMRRNSSEGLAFFVTLMSTPQTLFGDLQKRADAYAAQIIQKRDAGWAQELGQKSGKTAALTTNRGSRSISQHVLDAMVRNMLETFRNESGTNLKELMILLLEPQRMGQFKETGSDYFTYKPVRQDLVKAIMNYDSDTAISLLTTINENAVVAFETFHNGSLKNIKELNDLVTDQTTWQGRVGEFRSVLRNKMDWTGMGSPLTEQLLANADRAPKNSLQNEFGEYIATGQGGGQLIASNELLKSAMQTSREIESNPTKRVFINARPSRRVTLDMAGLQEVMPHDLDQPMEISVRNPRTRTIEGTALYRDAEAAERNRLAKQANEDNKDSAGKQKVDSKGNPRPYVTPASVTLKKGDVDVVIQKAFERQNALAVKQLTVMALREHVNDGGKITDFDAGLGPRLMEAEAKTMEGMIAEQQKIDRDNECGGK